MADVPDVDGDIAEEVEEGTEADGGDAGDDARQNAERECDGEHDGEYRGDDADQDQHDADDVHQWISRWGGLAINGRQEFCRSCPGFRLVAFHFFGVGWDDLASVAVVADDDSAGLIVVHGEDGAAMGAGEFEHLPSP